MTDCTENPESDCPGYYCCKNEDHGTRPAIPEQATSDPRPDMPLVQPRAETHRTRPIMPGGIAYIGSFEADAGTPLPGEEFFGEHPALPEGWRPIGYAAPEVSITENNEHALPLQVIREYPVEITDLNRSGLNALIGPAPLGPPIYKVSFDGENAYRCPVCDSDEWEITLDEESTPEELGLTMTCRHHGERNHL